MVICDIYIFSWFNFITYTSQMNFVWVFLTIKNNPTKIKYKNLRYIEISSSVTCDLQSSIETLQTVV